MAALCSAGILAAGCASAPKSDARAAEGSWHGQEAGVVSDQGSPTLMIQGDRVEFHDANPIIWFKGTLTLDESPTPKQFALLVTECPLPPLVGQTIHGIYRLVGGKLTLSAYGPGAAPVPTAFDAPGAHQFVFTH